MIERDWDAVVIGAGVAGAVTAGLLAKRGWRVLLVEKKTWPRTKACGGCLNAGAVRMLEELGFGAAIDRRPELRRITIVQGRCGRVRRLTLDLPGGRVVERADLDRRLVEESVRRGCEFMSGASARVRAGGGDGWRAVTLRDVNGSISEVRAGVVLACDGLGGGSLVEEPWATMRDAPGVRLGFAVTVAGEDVPKTSLAVDELGMYVGCAGYVGVAPLGGVGANGMHLGAALDPHACHAAGGPLPVMQGILRGCGIDWNVPPMPLAGTGPLCRRRNRVAGERVIAVGDSCGYVEPFTGEGMAWAIRGALAAAEVLGKPGDWQRAMAERWQRRYEQDVRSRQAWCQGIRRVLRWPAAAAGCIRLAQVVPAVPAAMVRRICA